MTETSLDISLIVSSRNRAHALGTCLDAIAEAARRAPELSLELVFVDNGSTDGTSDVVRAWGASAPIETRLLLEDRPGLSHARNTGMLASRGRLLAFTDDDCEVAPDYFSTIAGLFAGDAGLALRGGKVELGDARDLPITIKTSEQREVLHSDFHVAGFIHGCNMAFPWALVREIGLFDPRFGAGAEFRSGEDTDFIHRAFLAGALVEYRPELSIRHHHGRRLRREFLRLDASYAFGNGAIYAKYLLDRRSNMRGMFRWELRQALREALGGPRLDAAMGLTFRGRVWRNVIGMLAYGRSMALRPGAGAVGLGAGRGGADRA